MKLAPNFSWQKYDDDKLTREEQFQLQLQTQYIDIANAINTDVNDTSFWLKERPTSFTWVNGKRIFTKTITGVITVTPGDTAIPHGITGISQVISMNGTVQDAVPMATFAFPLPYLDPLTLAQGIGLYMTPTNVVIRAGNATWNGYTATINLTYTKV